MKNAATAPSENVPKAIILTLVSLVIFGVQDIAVKLLVADFSVMQVVMIRFWGVALFTLIWIGRNSDLRLVARSHYPKLQILRSVLLLIDIWLFSAALGHMQTSDLQAMFMLYPIVVSLLAVPILGEKMGIYRWIAVLVGFVGAMVVIRPGFQTIDVSIWLVVGAVLSFSLYTVLTRKVATKDSTKTSMLYLALVALVLSTVTGVFELEAMGMRGWLLMIIVIVCAIATHLLFTVALKHAPASTLQPLNFLALPVAVGLTLLFFGHMTDVITLIGGAITIGAGLLVWFRETKSKKAPTN
ncbi:DMT family transporter [Maritalea porphyrae]|uniref:DMT family transporter n=2 Tax=Maritalea TaxID=623276 RepID=UPI0022AF7512|nr:DMT family transporter [Maritalea porphyrae]MCZ4273911.1 DMT family transporter [Maritalea porphyrae]